DDERQQIEQRRTDAEAQTRESRARLEQTIAKMADLESARNGLETERQQLSQQRDQQRELARAKRQATHELALRLESQRARLTSLAQSVERMTAQRGQLESRRGELSEQLAQGDAPVADLEKQRQTCLDQRVQVDRLLSEARSTLDGIENQLREQEGKRQQFDQQGLALREKQSALRLEEQALAMKAESLDRGIVDAGLELTAVIENLPENADASGWQQALESLENRIRRLEPVNLAAIQEFEEQGKRKEYLDSQHGDLTSALETLETAIRKIDRETRGRFKDTFDRVNSGLQELYPRLFGGGHAYLDLTGEDLLDTGVSIMARPPGKRVSNINLLSGGEKALTAVALVFAIFRLNPAPFCMLDEVDAPLDEANVGRFCAMVSEMSERVQFLFVTHNKATMEAAHQLAGVTMREPGVSRLVSVDLDEATRLAGAA
ncbi:MAG: chromosome segregation protein SMC, partial [Xanthomonadales bacterium]|nr:chromosome segregation protein SMC [Xanthomonadales bacterium]